MLLKFDPASVNLFSSFLKFHSGCSADCRPLRVIDYMKAVKRRLEERRIPVYMVQAQVGQSFAELTRIGVGRAKGMVAFCTSEYGAYTGAGDET
jgi:hypothetical protein